MNARLTITLLAALLLVAPGCGKQKLAPTQPVVDSQVSIDRPDLQLDHSRHHGEAAEVVGRKDGAIYALYRPAQWNGDLVVYVHGYTAPYAPISLPTGDSFGLLRDRLLERRYAVAVSSWSENGFAVKDAIKQSNRLPDLFAERLGRPKRVYLIGVSLGGLATIALAERDHDDFEYDGALLLSPVAGGSRHEIEYIANVRVLFDTFYPNKLRGDLLHQPADLDINRDVIGAAVAAIQADPRGAIAMSQIAQTPLPFRDANELVSSIVQALVYHAVEIGDLLARTGGESFFENSQTQYTGGLPPAVLADVNARVARHQLSPRAAVFLKKSYEPSGDPEIPVLVLHNAWDPVVPIFNQNLYRDRVAAHGESRRLVQRVFQRYGHVGFKPEESAAAFDDLTRWVRKHERPLAVDAALVRQPVAMEDMKQQMRSGVSLQQLEYVTSEARRPSRQ